MNYGVIRGVRMRILVFDWKPVSLRDMKKVIFIVLIIVFLAVAGAAYYLLTNLDTLVAASIEKYGSQAIKTEVSVAGVDIRLKDAQASISGLRIANPEGFEKRAAFSLADVIVRLDIGRTGRQLITITKIKIDKPQIYYEMNRDRQSNLDRLKANILAGRQANGNSGNPAAATGDEPRLHIKELNVIGADLSALLVPLKNKTARLSLPDLRLTNLKGTPQQISRQIVDALIDHAKAEMKKSPLAAELERLKGEAKQQLDAEKAKLQQKADEKLDTEKQKVQDKLKGLLGN